MGTFISWIGFIIVFTYLTAVHGWFLDGKGLKDKPEYEDSKEGGYLWLGIGILLLVVSFFIE